MTDKPIPTNAKERQELKGMLGEITNCMLRMDSERDAMKDIAKAAEDKFGIKAKVIRKLARTMYKHDYATVQSENEHFEFLYESLVEGKKVDGDTE